MTSNNGITNATGAIIQTDKINNTRGNIINNGSLKSTTEINSVGNIDNYGDLKTKNLISNTRLYNRQGATLETENIEFKRSKKVQILAFYDILKKSGINVTIRKEFGGNVDAACGQLRAKSL